MYRSIIKLLIKHEVSFPVFESTRIIRRVSGLNVSLNYKSSNCQIRSFKNPCLSNCAYIFESKKRFSQKADVGSCSNHGDTRPTLDGEKLNEVSDKPSNVESGEEDADLFDNVNYEEITGGDSDTLNQLKLIMLEVDVLRQDGFRIPKRLTTESWKELLTFKSRNQKRKFLEFLWVVEIRKANEKKKKEIRKKELEEKKAEFLKEAENNDHIVYGFRGNTIFIRVYDTSINSFDNHRLIQAMLHGIDVVIDCGYDANMSIVENKLCAKQLCFLFAENRLHKEPFNLHFCNVNKNSVWFKSLHKFIPTLDDPGFPFNLHENHYSTLFPKEKLVYLTPHCRTELKEFNPDDVYIIVLMNGDKLETVPVVSTEMAVWTFGFNSCNVLCIGALVDRQNNEPLSMAKAKSEGIRMAQLPLDRYLDWDVGTKSLTLNQMINILLEVRTSGNWDKALEHVPRRKIKQGEQPKEDLRRYNRNRGTTFQPPSSYRKTRKLW